MEQLHYVQEVTRLQRSELAPREVLEPTVNGKEPHEPADSVRLRIDPTVLKDRPIVMPSDTGPAAHAYRMMRTQLLQRIRQLRRPRQQCAGVIGIVSAADREGKTLTAVNLALSLAADTNKSVLLMDLDLHRPSVASMLKLQVEHGLESWFNGWTTEIERLIYPVEGFERLFILPTLAKVAGSSEVLAGVRAQSMLDQLREVESDRFLLVDLPPLLLTDDFLTIASFLDGVVIVAREGKTKREDLTRMRDILGSVTVLGTVLNHSSEFERRAY